jgi:uncharacterized protein (DUF58 family)
MSAGTRAAPPHARRMPTHLGPRQVGLTVRGGVMLAAGITAAVAAWRLGQPIIAGLGAAAALAVLAALAWQYLSPPPEVEIGSDTDLIDLGDAFTVRATIERTRTPVDVVWPLLDETATGRRSRAKEMRGVTWQSANATFTRRAVPVRRGCYATGPVAVVRWDPFAVTRTAFLLDDSAVIDVAPAVHTINARPLLPPTSSGPSHSGRAGDRAMHARTWQPGDQRRDVHWRATARSGTLMTYEHDAVSPEHIAVVVDSGDDDLGDLRVAWALSLAAALVGIGWQATLSTADPTGAEVDAAVSLPGSRHDALRRAAARLPRSTTRRWPDPGEGVTTDAAASVIAVVSDAAVPPQRPGGSAAIVVGADGEAVDRSVAAARTAGWRAVGAVIDLSDPARPESAILGAALAELSTLHRSRR